MNDVKYYLTRDPETSRPLVLYRFFTEASRTPEALCQLHPWQADSDVRLLRMSGEIGSADLIGEEEASEVAKGWGHTL